MLFKNNNTTFKGNFPNLLNTCIPSLTFNDFSQRSTSVKVPCDLSYASLPVTVHGLICEIDVCPKSWMLPKKVMTRLFSLALICSFPGPIDSSSSWAFVNGKSLSEPNKALMTAFALLWQKQAIQPTRPGNPRHLHWTF